MSSVAARVMRLAKHLAHARRRLAPRGRGARSSAGRVTVDGEVVHRPGARRRRAASAIAVDGEAVGARARVRVVYALHKPAGRRLDRARHPRPPDGRRPRARARPRLYPVGRLDADSTGLILLTDDGDLAHRLTHPRFEVPEDLRRAGRRRAASTDGALRRAARRASSSTTGAPRRPTCAGSRPRRARADASTRAASARCAACARPSATRPLAQARRLRPAEARRPARGPARRRCRPSSAARRGGPRQDRRATGDSICRRHAPVRPARRHHRRRATSARRSSPRPRR